MISLLSCFFTVLMSLSLLAQADQRWIPESPDTLQVKGGITAPGLDFVIKDSGPSATYVPNTVTNPYIAFSYNRLGFSLQLPTDPDDESIRKKGRSKVQDYQLRFFGHRSTWEFVYQDFKGYSLQEWFDNNEPVIRPDIGIRNVSVNYIRALSPRHYSLAVAFDQKGMQEHFGQSWFLWSSLVHNHAYSDQPMIPTFVTTGRTDLSNLTNIKSNSLLAGVGYGMQWPFWSRAYITAAPFVGAGISDVETISNARTRNQLNHINRVGIRIGVGYNGNLHFGGLSVIADSNNLAVLGGTFSQSTFNVRLFYGYRFEEVNLRWIKRLRRHLPLPDDSLD
jgi:hypothetical protein